MKHRSFNRKHMKKSFRKMPRIILSMIVIITIPMIPIIVLINNKNDIIDALNESLDIIIGKDATK